MASTAGSPPIQAKKRRAGAFRFLLLAACALALAAGLAPVGLNLIFPPEKLARFLEDSLSGATGRKVSVSGDAHFTLYPWLGLKFGPLTVNDAEEFGGEPMLEIVSGSIRMRLLPLLSKEAAPADIVLEDVTLRLKRKGDGRANWLDLPFLADENAFSKEVVQGWTVVPRPRGMRITGGAVIVEDQLTGRSATLNNLALKTGYGEHFNFSLSFEVEGHKSGVTAEAHATGLAAFESDKKRLTVRDAVIEILGKLPSSVTGAAAGAPPATIALRAKADFDSAKANLKVYDLEAHGLDGRLNGEAEAGNIFTDPGLAGRFQFHAAAGGRWLAALGVAEDMEGVPRLEAAVDPTSARFEAAPGAYADEISLESAFTADGNRLSLKDAIFSHGQARLTGEAIYASGKEGAAPRLTFALRAKSLDLDQLAPPERAGRWKPGRFIPKDLSMRGTLDASDLLLDKGGDLRLQDIHVTASAENGRLRFYPVAVLIPGGLFSADVRARAENDALAFDARAEAVTIPGRDGLTEKTAEQTLEQKNAPTGEPAKERNAVLSLHLQGTAATKGVSGKMTASGFAPADLRGILRRPSKPVPEGDGHKVAATADFSITPGARRLWESAAFENCALTVDDAALTGSIVLHNGDKTTTVVDLKTDRLKAADLLAFEPDPKKTAPDEAATNAPVPGLPNVEGKISVKNLDLFGVPVNGFAASGRLRQGLLEIEKLDGEAYGGRLEGNAKAGFLGEERALAVSARVAGAKASLLTQSLAGTPLAIAATDIRLDLEGKGATDAALAASLKGRLVLEAAKGGKALPVSGKNGPTGGFDISKAAAEITLKGKPAPSGRDKNGGGLFDAKGVLSFSAPGTFRKGQVDLAATLGFGRTGRLESVSEAKIDAFADLAPAGSPGQPPEGLRQNASMTGALRVDPAKGTWKADDLKLILGPAVASASLSGATEGEDSGFAGSVQFQDFDPRRLLDFLGTPPPSGLNKDLLQSAGLSFGLAGKKGRLSLSDIVLRVDDVTARGEASFPGYSPTKGKFRFSVDRLDMDAYTPPPESTLPQADEPPYNLSFLRSLDLNVDISLGTLIRNRITWGDATLSVSAHNGQFTYVQKAGKFYGGLFNAQAVGDARDITLKFLLELKIEGFDCAQFLRDWVDGAVLNSGETTFVLAFRSNGLTEMEMRKNLAGSFRFQATRGSLLLKETSSGSEAAPAEPIPHAAVRPDLQPPPTKDETLNFDVFSASFTVREGVAYTEDFLIKGKDLTITGKGSVDLRDESVDLTLSASQGEGTNIPVTIIGKLENPAVNIDRSKIVGDMIYRALRGVFTLPERALRRSVRPLQDMKDLLHF